MQFNPLVPELEVLDFPKSFAFYTQVLGFTVEYQREEDSFAFLSLEGSQIMIEQGPSGWDTGPLDYPLGRGINFEMGVALVEPLLQSLGAHGYPLFRELHDNWYRKGNVLLGNREFLVLDPNGYTLRFVQALGERPVE